MSGIRLRDYQDEIAEAVRQAYRDGYKAPLVVLPTGGGKCLGKGTPVLMFDGRIKPVEDIKVGDLLMGPDSTPRRVLSLARGREALYRVAPNKGAPYTVNESHILSLKETGTDRIINIGVLDYLKASSTFKHCAKGWRAAVDFPPAPEPLRIPAYILGVWLGDGNSAGFGVTSGDPEICQELVAYADRIGMKIRVQKNSAGSVILFFVNKLGQRGSTGRGGTMISNALREYGLLMNKHIPHQYLTAGRHDRLELMAGIIDTDGSWTGKGYDLTLKNERLMDGVIFIARSLGFSAYKASSRKVCTNTGAAGQYWRCTISGHVDEIPCRIKRKSATPRRMDKNPLLTGIRVEPIGEGDYYGFEIDGDRLFMLGDFTVTHNTTIFAYVTAGAAGKGRCVFLIAHRAELVKQIAMTLARFGVDHKVIAPGPIVRQVKAEQFRQHGRTFVMPTARVYVCSVDTLIKRFDDLPKADAPNIIVIDEAHHLTDGSKWGKVVARYPQAKLLPVTATPIRLDGKGLGLNEGGFADTMVCGPTLRKLIDDGYLSEYAVAVPPVVADTTGVRKTGSGDFNQREAAERVDKPKITGGAVEHYLKLARGRRAVAFTHSVKHAQNVANDFNDAGVPAAVLDGTLDPAERDRRIKAFEAGQILVLASCDVVSEGFDVPAIEVAILLRSTASLSLFIQQVGRALRPVYAPGFDLSTREGRLAAQAAGPKPQALILDHVGNVGKWQGGQFVLNHGLPDAGREWTLEGIKKKARAPQDEPPVTVRTCPACFAIHAPAPKCPVCGHAYKTGERKIEVVDAELYMLNQAEQKAAAAAQAVVEKAAQKRARITEERQCETEEQLAELGRARGYRFPELWAKRRWQFIKPRDKAA